MAHVHAGVTILRQMKTSTSARRLRNQSGAVRQYLSDGHPVVYWIQLRSKYPYLGQFAIDILTIPASSCECERLFSELGDLLEPKQPAIGSEL